MTTKAPDTSPESVERLVERLRNPTFYTHPTTEDGRLAADMLRALLARLQEAEAEAEGALMRMQVALSEKSKAEAALTRVREAEAERNNWRESSRRMTEFYEHRGRLLEQETARAEKAEAALAEASKELRDEFVRQNLATDADYEKSLTKARAETAAVIEAAAAAVERHKRYFEDAAAEIRALTPAHATAALDEIKRQVREEGRLDGLMEKRALAMLRRGMNAPEDPHVELLCERYGYGAVMDAASRLWARKDSIGAFFVGGCIGLRSDDEARALIERKS